VASAHAAFAVGADHAFIAATLFVGATVLVLAVAIRGRRATARVAAGDPQRVPALGPGTAVPKPVETPSFVGSGASLEGSYEMVSMVVSEADRERDPQLTATH
jgi:hypothetical protein